MPECLPPSPEDKASALIIHQAGEGNGSKLLCHGPAETQHRPVSTKGDGLWRRYCGEICFLSLKTGGQIRWPYRIASVCKVSTQRPIKFLLFFFCWGFQNSHLKFYSLPLPFLASKVVAHSWAGNGSWKYHRCCDCDHDGDKESNHNITKLC